MKNLLKTLKKYFNKKTRIIAVGFLSLLFIFSLVTFIPKSPAFSLFNISITAAALFFYILSDYFKKKKKPIKIGMAVIRCLFLLFIAYYMCLSSYMVSNIKDSKRKNDTVIVLGCSIIGDEPSKMLKQRLDRAYEYLVENDTSMCIVAGGMAENYDYPESYVMRKYLLEKGINESRIIEESKSTNTEENLKFSYKIIEELSLNKNITVISSNFHITRAKLLAANLGMDINTIGSDTWIIVLPTSWTREIFGITRVLLLGY